MLSAPAKRSDTNMLALELETPVWQPAYSARQAGFFYAGTLLSSIGSMTFTICLTAFMLQGGSPLMIIGISIAANRLIPLLVNLIWGDLADRQDPRHIILVTEALASALSVCLLFSWNQDSDWFWGFLALLVARSSVVVLQTGARGRIAKALGSHSLVANSKSAVWLNKATHGAAIFGGVIGWLFVRYGNFEHVILFDLTTFLVAGVLLWFSKIHIPNENSRTHKLSVFAKFHDLYRLAPVPALLDLLLAIATSGMGTLVATLSDGQQELVPLFLITYGAAVWASGFLCRLEFFKEQHTALWIVLAISFVAAFASIGSPFLTLPLIFIRDLSYWSLFHRYTAQIQHATPATAIAGVSAARTVQVVAVLSIGEIGVGLWGPHITHLTEAGWRAALCLVIATLLIATKLKTTRPAGT